MKTLKMAAALTLAGALLASGSALALFGRKEAPPAGAPEAEELDLRTYRDTPAEGCFQVRSGGEGITFQVEKFPRKGTVTLEGDRFTYTPDEGLTGRDYFTYTATDAQGRTSAPAAVEIQIRKTRSGVRYADLEGNGAASAAQELAEEGIFTGARIGGAYCFEPEKTVSRGEFLAMAMKTLDLPVTSVTRTGFQDDAAIPAWARPYAAMGVAKGLVKGKTSERGPIFESDAPVTFAQAAAILDRGLELSDVDLDTWYGDREELPSWAAQAVGNLESVRILSVGSFGSAALERPVTRADAAKMLCAVRALLKER